MFLEVPVQIFLPSSIKKFFISKKVIVFLMDQIDLTIITN